jgi:hypothetical protein
MDNFETPSPTPELDHSPLQAEVDSLRQLMVSVLILLIVISGTLNIFLLRQWRSTQTEVKGLRAMVDEYNRVNGPAISSFAARLNEFERTHPNLSPILDKYGLRPSPTSAPPASAARPPTKPAKK